MHKSFGGSIALDKSFQTPIIGQMFVSQGCLSRGLPLYASFASAITLFHVPAHNATPRVLYAGAVQEVHSGSATIPSIVVVTPEDTDVNLTPTVVREAERYQPAVRISSLPSATVQTARPPLPESHHS